MVSNASEDLPEPDSPVNTTSLSRGISTSTFLRLCSRAPRIVIARRFDPTFGCWRFALITSSILVVLRESKSARSRQQKRRASPGTGIGADGVVSERRKNGDGFPVGLANRQRIVGALAASGRSRVELRGNVPDKTKRPAQGRPFVTRMALGLSTELSTW